MQETWEWISSTASAIGFAGPYIPNVIRSIATYYIVGPDRKSWSLRFHIALNFIKYLLYRHNTFEKLYDLKELTQQPPPNTSQNIVIEQTSCTRQKLAVDFIIKHGDHIPFSAKDTTSIIKAEWVSAKNDSGKKVFYWLHGGAYIFGSPQLDRRITYILAKSTQSRVFAISYRLAPDFEYPCALVDSLSGYMFLLDSGYSPKDIVIGGASAGGGLTAATLLAIRDMGLPFPAGAVLISPWVDLTSQMTSFALNKKSDYLPNRTRALHGDRRVAYAPNEVLESKYVSPLFAESLSGINCPILIQVGDAERLHDEGIALGKRLTKENLGMGVRIEDYADQVHVFHSFQFLPSAKTAFIRIGKFANEVMKGGKIVSEIFNFDPYGDLPENKGIARL